MPARIPRINGKYLCSGCDRRLDDSEFRTLKNRYGAFQRVTTCRKCERERAKKNAARRYAEHKDVIIAQNKKYRDENKDLVSKRVRKFYLRVKYGLSPTQFDEMLQNQKGKCAICGTMRPGGSGTFHVDHCHVTGKIRGLLCGSCNKGIGMFGDNIETILAAIEYLKRNQ